jgi:peptide/nickel transport system substrate-binding protein
MSKLLSRHGFLVLASLALGSLAACRREAEPRAPVGAATTSPLRGGTLVAASIADMDSVNELLSANSRAADDVIYRIFSHLLDEQADFENHPPTFAPELAERWEWSADDLVLTFHLRKDAVWTDGVPITAEDVRFTWEAQKSPDLAWDTAYMKENIRDVEVVDPHTVRFHFTRIGPGRLIEANEGLILPKHVWGQVPFEEWRQSADFFRDHLVSSGPFKLERWSPQQEIVLARNERYWNPAVPYLDRVVIRILPDVQNRVTQLLAGSIDLLEQVPMTDLPRIESTPNLRLHAFWHRSYQFIAWNAHNPLFANKEVRRALTLAIDRQGLVDALWGKWGRVGDSPIVQNVWAHNDAIVPWPYDPAEARRLLAAAGYKDSDGDGILDQGGRKFSFDLVTNQGNSARMNAVVMIQEQLKKVGIEARPRLLEFNAMNEAMTERRYDAVLSAWGMPTTLDLRYAFHSDSIRDGDNHTFYSNPEVDRLIEEIERLPDIGEAKSRLDRAQQWIHEDQPMTFLWESQRINGFNRRVQNAQPNLLSTLWHLHEWWLTPAP